MKKIGTLMVLFLVLVFSCQKDLEPNEPASFPKGRITKKNQVIPLVSSDPLKINLDKSIGYVFTLIAEVDAPVVSEQTVQATHVELAGELALVSYNMRGAEQIGALDIIDVSDPYDPVIVKTIEFPGRDVNTVGWKDGMIVIAGQDVDGAFYGYLDPALEEPVLELHRLPSHSGISLVVQDDLTYFASGRSGGGLTIVDGEGQETFTEYPDARSVAAGQEVYTLSKENIFVLDGSSIDIDPAFIQDFSKAELDVSDEYLFAALNRGGAHVYHTADLSLAQMFSRPAVPAGKEPEDYVTNSVSFNPPLFFLGNGAAGIAVSKHVDVPLEEQPPFIEYGYFDFGGPLSTNFVMSQGNFVFVATGLGGLKILTIEEEECNWTFETAFAGSDAGGGAAWWYYFDNTGDGTHPIYAGQQLIEGAYAQYADGVLTIVPGPNMAMQDVAEAVKIQGYNEGELPTERPAAGLFTTYKGNDLVIELDYYPYYVIHLSVMVCN
ncbi:MAG: hypothetical protein RBS53_09780 [Bacteroidales bacterium]|jgi:hypothetical protein|nr:hypothetical protein [Bacteroidales bacterium]NLM93021.1 hypothetical protein [Bacteroidales bacterium]